MVLIPYGFTVRYHNDDKGYQYEEFVNCSHTNLGMTPYRLLKSSNILQKPYL